MTKNGLDLLKVIRMAVILPALLLLSASNLSAQTWTGSVSNNWHDARNWSPQTVPGSNSTIIIDTASPNSPETSQNLTISGKLTISNNASLIINSKLILNGEIHINDGTLNVKNELDINGLLKVTTGNVNIVGSTDINGIIDGGAGKFTFNGDSKQKLIIRSGGRFYMAPSSPGNHPPYCDPNTPEPPALSGGSIDFLLPSFIENDGRLYGGDAIVTFAESTETQGTAGIEIHNGNLIFNGNSVVKNSGYMAIICKGSIQIEGDASFENNGSLTAEDGNIYLEGNVTLANSGGTIDAGSSTIHFSGGTFENSGTFNAETSTFIFEGEGTQEIIGKNSDIVFYNLVVEDGASVHSGLNVLVENDMTVDENGEFNVGPEKTLDVIGDVYGDQNVSTNRPYIIAIGINALNSITAIFNDSLDQVSAETASNYRIEDEAGDIIDYPSNPILGGEQNNEVILTLGYTMVENEKYFLIVNNVTNLSDRPVNEDHKKKFGLSETSNQWEWTGKTDSDWNTSSNWKKNKLPTVYANVYIPVTANNPVISSAGNRISNVTIESGAALTIGSTGNLTVENTVENLAGTGGLIIASDPEGTGSLIHNNSSVPATFQRYISGEPQAWQMISSPVADQVLAGDITPTGGTDSYGDGTRYDFYAWYEPDTSWVYLLNDNQPPTWNTANGSNSFIPGRGYLISYKDPHPTISFGGNLNNGAITVDVTKSAGETTEFGQNLLGNPYPSSIDWKAASGWNRENLATTGGGYDIWIWSETNLNYGAYNSSSSSDEGTLGVGRYIAPNQGFFVKASQSGIVSMDNSVRVHQGAGNWLKSAKSNDRSEVVKLTIESSAGFGRDEVVVEFGHQQNETGTRKKFSFIPSAPSLFIPGNELSYSIRMVGDKEKNAVLPVSFKVGAAGNYTLTADFPSGWFDFLELYDKLTGMRHNLKEQPAYSFQAAPKDRTDRFVLQVAPGHFADPHNLLPVNVYARQKTLHVDMRLLSGQFNCDVFSLSGQQIAKKIVYGGDVSQIDIPVAATMVVVHISGNEGKVYKKVPVF